MDYWDEAEGRWFGGSGDCTPWHTYGYRISKDGNGGARFERFSSWMPDMTSELARLMDDVRTNRNRPEGL